MAEDAPNYEHEQTRLLLTLSKLERGDGVYIGREIKESVGDVIGFGFVLRAIR